MIERFEETAYDVATARDGRVVKLIGDEVMFVTVDPAAACDIGLTLFERFADDAAVTPRGGLAYGDLLLRGGDYYGAVVNLAARVAADRRAERASRDDRHDGRARRRGRAGSSRPGSAC